MIQRKEVITEYARTGSMRATARNLGISRSTVKRYVTEHEMAKKAGDAEYTAYLKSEPQYNRQAKTANKVLTDTVKNIIDNCLAENELKIRRGDRKLCMKATDILERLHKAGIKISYPTVCRYIQTKNRASSRELECYIRQVYSPGEDCEFDWGELHLTIEGIRIKLYMAVFTLAYSNYRMAFLFLRQDTMAFLESHRMCFDIFTGSPRRMVYDNMRVAVASFTGTEKLPTDALLRLEHTYGFRHRFCNIRAGNEKGHVERSVEFIRRKAFSQRDTFGSIEEANRHLYDVCMDLNMTVSSPATADIIRKGVQDLEALLPLRDTISCFEPRRLTVDKYSTVVLGGVHYSVPDTLVGKKVYLHEYANRVNIYLNQKIVAEHEKTPRDGWKLDIMHYISTFERKLGALDGSMALTCVPDLKDIYLRDFQDNPALFIALLKRTRDENKTLEDFIVACDDLHLSGINPGTPGAVEQILFRKTVLSARSFTLGVSADEIERHADSTLSQLSDLMN